ncbi:MAG TPA: hypothetical protein VGY13_00215 [Solirubrobacteraceae bacterium]|jgi:hypothetical protein|nr:hypothetical protein [Solirubrobacteraceae bacterium]
MSNPRRFQLEELTLRPGTYFNPQTEIMIVVDDSPEIDHEIFESQDFESDEWVLISEDAPVDESKRDDMVERFQLSHGTSASGEDDDFDDLDDDDEDDDEEDEDDELDGVDELDFDDE